jgi:hypothetical protein
MKISLTSLFLGALLVFGFQNCSPTQLQFEDVESMNTLKDFNYAYSSKPSNYVQSLLVMDADPNPGKTFSVRVFIGTPSSSSDLGLLHLEVRDESGTLLCPQDTLDLSSSVKDWSVDCVPPSSNFSEAIVTLSVTGSAEDFSLAKTYSLD